MSPQSQPVERLEPRRLLSAGDLDPAFGAHGVLTYPDIAAPPVGIATQSDGKYVVATHTALYRFRANGTIDKSFGHRGHIVPGFTLRGLGIDHNGRIAVGGGTKDFQWAAARYLPDGSPDPAFNGTGQIIVPTTQAKVASVMTLQPDGKILVGGTQRNDEPDNGDDDELYDATIVRFNTDGSVDTAFGTNGQVPGYHLFNLVNAIALAPNGNIVIAGQENLGMSIHDERFEVVDSAGRPVTGHAASTPDFYTSYRAAAFRPDGTRVLADEAMGNSVVSFDNRDVGVWFDPLSPDGPTDEKVNAIVTTADDKSVLAGYDHEGNVGLLRFNPDGTPDDTFGFGGSSSIDLNRRKAEWIDRLALLPNGDFLAAGSIGGGFPDAVENTGARLFVVHIKGGAHPVGDLAPRAASSFYEIAPSANAATFQFTVTYAAEQSIDASSIGNRDVRVLGPNGYSALAQLVSVTDHYNGRQRIATYQIDAPGGTWERGDNGRYTIYLRPNQVTDNHTTPVPAGIIGAFTVRLRKGHHTATTAAVTRALSLPAGTLPDVTDTATDAAGNVYRAGRFTGTVDFDPSPSGTLNLTAQSTDAYVAKFAPDGALLWARQWGTAQPTALPKIGVTRAGDVYLAADYSAPVDADPSPAISNLPLAGANRNLFLIRLDTQGNFVRANAFSTPGQDLLVTDVAPAPDGRVVLVASGQVPGVQNSDDYKGDAHYFQLSARLRTLVHHRWATPLPYGVVEADSMALDRAGDTYISGTAYPGTDFAPGRRVRTVPGSATDSPFLLRVTAAGLFDWVLGYDFAPGASPTILITGVDRHGDVRVAGRYPASTDFNPSPRKHFNLQPPNNTDGDYTAFFSPRGALLSAEDTTSLA